MTSRRQWFFSPRGFNDVEQEVTEADQFNTETVPGSEALVREATQNSQDARDRDRTGPVKLRISLIGKADGLDEAVLKELTHDLMPHLKECGIEIGDDLLAAPLALVIEDFGTEGLTGRIDDENDPGNFRSFWFRHGSSYKKGSNNGRWGLGKLVFPMMSGARCFFGLTIRKDNAKPLLLGQAVLKTHKMDGTRYAPHGHFGDTVSDDHLSPISDPAFIGRFTKAFGLKRVNEPGLSVVVPFPRAEADREMLLEFVVRNYAYPILTGKLVVEVLGLTVDAAGIRTIGKGLLKPGLTEFIENVHETDRTALFRVKERSLGKPDRLTEDMVEGDLAALREKYAAGELIGFHIPVVLARKKTAAQKSYVEVFFRRRFDTEEGDALYVRGDITIPDEAARFRGAGAFAALLAQDAVVSEFLADAENPAHTKWAGTAKRVNDNWKYPTQTLTVIRDALPALHRMLATGRQQVDARALTTFFWIDDQASPPAPGGSAGPRPKTAVKGDPPSVPVPPPAPARRKLILTKRTGGFAIKPGPAFSEVVLPAQIKIDVCYDIEVGKAKWDKLDFDLVDNAFTVTVTGADEERMDNRIILTVEQPDFELIVDGFDEKRDLVVDYNLIKAREAALA